jgi:uncharacterized lipoprotein
MTTQDWKKTITSMALLMGLLSLVACGGRSTVVTHDDSAEYRDARSLPPLKKPNAPDAQTSEGLATQTSTTAPVAAPVQSSAPTQTSGASQSSVISANVIETNDNQVALQINGDVDAAWRYLRTNLKRSDITVHTRNKAAGRFAIGCAGIDSEEGVAVTKSGGWSIFRRKQSETEHCSLQLVADNDVSVVRAYDRSGQLVSAQLARGLFNRLLNN